MNTATRRPVRLRAALASTLIALLTLTGISVTAAPAAAATGDIAAATLNWGVKESFRSYIAGPIAHGQWTLSGNVTDSTPFAWSGGSGSTNPGAATGSVAYAGGIHFQGHRGFGGIPADAYALDLAISNVRVTQTSAVSATIIADLVSNSLANPLAFVTSPNVPFATVDLAAATPTSTAETVGFSGAPAVLTEAGAAAFAGFYATGTELDPVSFSWPVEQAPVVPPAPAVPTITVSKSSGISLEGEVVTVTGTGFAPNPPATSGTRTPLSGKFGGAYVAFGKYLDVWKPSAGAPASARANADTKWVVNAEDVALVGGAARGAVPINADGTFSVELVVKPGFANEPAAGNYGVYTYPGGGATYAPFETYTPISFAQPAPTGPTVTVSKSSGISLEGEIVTVTGTGFAPNPPATSGTRDPLAGKFGGSYVTFGKFLDVWQPSAGAPSSARKTADTKWVVNPEDVATVGGAARGAVPINADGTFSVDLLVKPGFSGEVDAGNYGIYTYPGGGATYAPFETYTPITFAQPAPEVPTVTLSKSTNISPAGEIVRVTGSGFTPNAPATSGTRSPLPGKFGGAYVTFGKFLDVWKPSAGAPASARKTADTKWVVNAEDVAIVGAASGGVAINPDGTFAVDLFVKPGFTGELDAGNYGIYTYPGSGATYAPFETYTPVTFATAIPTSLALTTTPAAPVEGGSLTLTARVSPATAGTVTFATDSARLATVPVNGSGVASATVSSLAAGTREYTATFAPADTVLHFGSSAAVSVTVAAAPAPAPVVGAGSLTWGVKASLRDYITGNIARGSITTSGVTSSGGAFVFGQATGGTYSPATGTGTSAYSGSVRFTGHSGVLDLTLSDPVVRVDSATRGTLIVTVNGRQTEFANLNLGAATKTTPDNTVRFAGVPATLTAQGAAVFSYNGSPFYAAGEALDALTFVIGATRTAAAPGAATVAAFARPAVNTPAPTVPTAAGITLEGVATDEVEEGGEYTFTADGFRANETGIIVVIYSTPVVLATNVTADANGRATWTGRLPAGLTGAHTLTMQGSVDRGIALTIRPSSVTATSVFDCLVDDATLTWGFKESFRSYISGSIANGEWTVADGATYDVPNFGWADGTGSYDPETAEGSLAFAGSIAFTGHGGILNTVVSNPNVRFDGGDTAVLLLDVTGTTQDGTAIALSGVEFAELDLAAATVDESGDSVTITGAPAVLTATGASAFGTYPEGEALDPVTIAFSTATDCGVEQAVVTEETVVETTEVEPIAATGSVPWWVIALAIALAVAAAIVAIVLVVRRRNANA